VADSADVRDVDALKGFDSFLNRFKDAMTNRNDEIRTEFARVTNWVNAEAPAYWRQETSKAEQRFAEASMALALCRSKVREEDYEACTDQQRQVDIWKRRLELCQVRNKQLKLAQQEWEQFVQESKNTISGAVDLADSEVGQAKLDLQKTIEVLERYTGL